MCEHKQDAAQTGDDPGGIAVRSVWVEFWEEK